MAIKINDIPDDGLTLTFAQNLDLFDTGKASTAFTAVLSIKPIGNGTFHIDGRLQSEPLLECSRCLKNFGFGINVELNIDVAPMSAMGTTPEHELVGNELDTEFYQGDEIEPLDFIKEQMLISIPMVPLHDPDCKGLCPVCGSDLNSGDCGCQSDKRNELGAFTVLKDLFKK